VHDYLVENASWLTSYEQVLSVARVASNYDLHISDLVARAMIDSHGTVVIEEGQVDEDYLTLFEGYKFNRGYLSDSYVTEPNIDIRFENPLILVVNCNLERLGPFLPILEKLKAAKRPFVVVAPDISDDVQSALLFNFKKDNITCCPIIVPLMQAEIWIDDVAAFTGMGVQVQDEEDLVNLELSDLGYSERVIIDRDMS
jgi:chaperonin GroEL